MSLSKSEPFPLNKVIKINLDIFVKILNDLSDLKTDQKYYKLKDEFNLNGNSVKLSEFKSKILPRLSDQLSEPSALILMTDILYNDYQIQNSRLVEYSLDTDLVPQLVNTYDNTSDSRVRQSIHNIYFVLCLVLDGNQKAKKLFKNHYILVINSIVRQLNGKSLDKDIVKESLLLIQCLTYYSPEFESTSQVLWPLRRLIGNNDLDIVSESLYTLLIWSERFQQSRQVILKSAKDDDNLVKDVLQLWADHKSGDETIVKPIFGLIMGLMVRLPEYKAVLLNTNGINILSYLPDLASNGSQLTRMYVNSIIKFVAMKSIANKSYNTSNDIQQLIDTNTVDLCASMLQNDPFIQVRKSALNAIIAITYNAGKVKVKDENNKDKDQDQLPILAERCLPALCSQLTTDDEVFLGNILLAIVRFLFHEFKGSLGKEKKFPKPSEELLPFAVIIRDNDGVRRLQVINDKRIKLEADDRDYELSQLERSVEEVLANGFGIETRHPFRQPNVQPLVTGDEIAKTKTDYNDCQSCEAAVKMAAKKGIKKVANAGNTLLFECKHPQMCPGCAVGALTKFYADDPKTPTCKVEKCSGTIPNDVPWYMFVESLISQYYSIQDRVEKQLDSSYFPK